MTPLLVHFGIPKTGSSSIQQTLWHNRDRIDPWRLLAFGQPNSSLTVNHAFSWAENLMVRHDPVKQAQARDRLAAALRAGDGAPAILSAETIVNLTQDELGGMLDFLRDHDARPRFIGYLRDPVSFTRSAMQERLKVRLFAALPFLPDAPLEKAYHLVVDRLDALAGRDSVAAFPFDRALFPQGDVVRHFLNQAWIEPDRLTLHRANDSLSATAVKALYAWRRLRVDNDAKIGSDATRRDFTARLARIPGPALRFAPELDARIAAANTHILDWSEARLGQRLALPPPAPEGGILTEADMLHFTPQDLDALATLARDEGLPFAAAPTPDSVADFVHALRLSVVTPPG
jgi:hypothetical protein